MSTMDRAALIALFRSTDGANWKTNSNWDTDAELATWAGVEVNDEGRVVQLILPDNNLHGPIPEALGTLNELTHLSMSGNHLTGSIPRELAGLVKLQSLQLDGNRLTGPIPAARGALTGLRQGSMHDNKLTASPGTDALGDTGHISLQSKDNSRTIVSGSAAGLVAVEEDGADPEQRRDSLRNDVSRGAGDPAVGTWTWTEGGTHVLVGRGRGSARGGGGSSRGVGSMGFSQIDGRRGGGGGEGDGGCGAREVPGRSWGPIRDLLFPDAMEQPYRETGNWNELFQSALDLPEDTPDQCYRKWERMTTVNRDFKAAAVTYGKTIISEYFLDLKHKSIKPNENLGGSAGGMKFVWRGILFKLADGSRGPYLGNDEAAAKGAGHDLRGATHYLDARIRGLRYALQCLIDYKGFRMTAQAVLPVSSETLRYGSSDAGRTVHNDSENLAKKLKAVAKKLNLRTHWVNDKEMYSACDIEGHVGEGGSHYLLDFARSFPPESPKKVDHLSDILSDRTPVYVHIYYPPKKGIILSAMVPLDRHNLARKNIKYQVLLDSTREVIEVFGDKISDRYQSVFWRMLRPEFVKGDSETMAVVGAHVGAAAVPTAAAAEARQELDSPAPAAARTLPIGFPSRISERPEEESGASSGATSGSSTGAALPMTAAFRPLASRGPQDGQGPAPDAAADTGGRAFGPVEHGDEAPPPLNPLSGHYEQGFLDDSERGVDVSGNGDEHAAPTGWNAPSIPGSGGEAVDNASPPSGSPAPTAAAAASPSVTFRRKVPQTPPVRGTPGRRTHGGGGRRGDATPPGRGMPGGGREGGRDPATDGYDANVETLTLTESGGSCEAFIDFDENNQYERGLPTGSLRAGSSNNWSFSSRRSRRIGLVGVQSYHFSSSYFGRAGSAPVYPDNHGQGQTGQSILFGGGGTGSEGNVGGGAGRGVVLEDMTRGRANVSYRFYPDPEPEPDDGDQQPAAVTASDDSADGYRFIPLSPDALTFFTKGSIDRAERNQEIHDATSVMLEVAVPNVVEKLTSLPQDVQKTLHLDVELHRHGVNVRHLGKVRFLLMEQNKPENGLLKDMMLTEMIARTLKNILRCFQRTWMKAEKSTSEQGMRMLVVRFLNLVTGAHINSATFWKEKVLTGVLQRFGLVSLTTSERRDVQKISRDPYVLQDCVFKLTEMQGVVLTEDTKAHFYADSPVGFEFTVSDIREINPIVRYMHILDYGGGVMLSMQAQRLMAEGKGNTRTVERLHGMANQFFITAYRSLPDDPNTRAAILSYSKSAGFSLFSSAPGDQPAHFSSGAGGVDAGESESDSGAAQSSETGTRSGLVIRSLTKMTSAFRENASMLEQERNNNDNDELGPPPGHSPGYFHFAGPERSRIPAPAPGMSQDRWSTRRREQPQQPAPTTTKGREDVLMTSLGPGPATYVSKRHSIEFELQAGSLDEELALEMTITRSLAFVDCRTEGSARAPFYDDASTEEFLAMNFVHGPEGVTFPEDKPAKLRFFLGYVDESTPAGEGLDQVAVSDEEIERDILKTYRPLTSPDGVGDWTTLGPYSVICRRQLGEREVWVETPVNHLRVFSNAMKTDKGGKNQSYYYGDMGGLRWWFKGRSSVPKVRFGNTTKEHCATFTCYPIVQHTAVSGESEGNGGIGAGGISLWGGRRDQHSAAGGATPAAFEKITNIVDVGTYEDCDLLCDLKQHLQMNVRVGILSNLEGVEVELTGRLQLLDSKKISGNKILVLRQLRLSRPSQFRKIDWPCDPEAICKI